MKRSFLALALLALAVPAARAESAADLDAKAILALSAARPSYPVTCVCGNGCDCDGLCGCATTGGCSRDCFPACEVPVKTTGPRPYMTYAEGRAFAIRENRPLAVWTAGYRCQPCISGTPDIVHVFVDDLAGDDTPMCVVGRPDGNGDLDRCGTITGACSTERIRGLLARKATTRVGGWSGGCANGSCAVAGDCGYGGCSAGAGCASCGGAAYGPPGGFYGGPVMMMGGCSSCGGGGRRR